jgi:hypothetical protein
MHPGLARFVSTGLLQEATWAVPLGPLGALLPGGESRPPLGVIRNEMVHPAGGGLGTSGPRSTRCNHGPLGPGSNPDVTGLLPRNASIHGERVRCV